MNDECCLEAFNDTFLLDHPETTANDNFVSHNEQVDTDSDNYVTIQETTANDSFISQNEQIDTDSENYVTEEEEPADEEDSIDSPPFSPISCASNNEPVEQQVIFEGNDSINALNGADINQNQWNGFTIVIDNFDKNIR